MRKINKNYESPKKFACAPADEALGPPDSLEFHLNALEYFMNAGLDLFKISKKIHLEQKKAEILNWLTKVKNCVQELCWRYRKILAISRNPFLDGQEATIKELIKDCRNHLEEKKILPMLIDYDCIKEEADCIMKYIDNPDSFDN